MNSDLNPNQERSDFTSPDSNNSQEHQIPADQVTDSGAQASADTAFDTTPDEDDSATDAFIALMMQHGATGFRMGNNNG